MNSNEQLKIIKANFEKYYNTDFQNAQEDTQANLIIRNMIRNLIIEAHKVKQHSTIEEALNLLGETTGCAEDYDFFIKITDELLKRGIINTEDIKKSLSNSPINRWR